MDELLPHDIEPFLIQDRGVAPRAYDPANPDTLLLWDDLDEKGGILTASVSVLHLLGHPKIETDFTFPPNAKRSGTTVAKDFEDLDVSSIKNRNEFLIAWNREELRTAVERLREAEEHLGRYPESADLKQLVEHRASVVGDITAWFVSRHLTPQHGTERRDHRDVRIEVLGAELEGCRDELSECRQACAELRKRNRELLRRNERPSKKELKEALRESRKKSGKPNWSALSRVIGVSDKMAKKYVEDAGLMSFAESMGPHE